MVNDLRMMIWRKAYTTCMLTLMGAKAVVTVTLMIMPKHVMALITSQRIRGATYTPKHEKLNQRTCQIARARIDHVRILHNVPIGVHTKESMDGAGIAILINAETAQNATNLIYAR